MAGARERILAIARDRERIISRQALVMSLATKVLSETATDKAVQLLVDATYKVVNCDRVSLFLVQAGSLVCAAAPAGGQVGFRLPLGKGIAGRVGASGETLNITDAYKRLDLFDPSNDLKTKYRTCSILCMPLKDNEGSVIGVLQAINKYGLSVPEFHAEEVNYVPFDSVDEKMLELLLALTAQQLRVCELVASKEAANDRADTVMQLLEAISSQRDIDSSVSSLGKAVASVVNCQQVFVYLREGEDLVCRAAHPLEGYCAERTPIGKEIVGVCAASGEELFASYEDNPEQLSYVQQLLDNRCDSPDQNGLPRRHSLEVSKAAKSAMCIPLKDSETMENIGVVLAVNKIFTLTDLINEGEGPQGNRPRRKSADGDEIDRQTLEAQALSGMLRGSITGSRPCSEAEIGRFSSADSDKLDVLVRLSAQMVTTAALYSQSQRTTTKLNALLKLLSGCSDAFETRDLQRVVLMISLYSREMFECDRCTFFMVDRYSGELVGHFVKEGVEGTLDQPQEFRVPMEGIAGRVASTGAMLNIKDAYAHPGFSRANDEKTGYRTKTLLGAPLTTSTGKVIGIIQCVNKIRNEYFAPEDEEMMLTTSKLLSDLIQRLLLQSSYKTFVQSSNSIEADVKDLFREYYSSNGDDKAGTKHKSDSDAKRISMSAPPCPLAQVAIMASLKSWSFDHEELGEDLTVTMPYVTSCFSCFGLLTKFNVPIESFHNFVQSVKASYISSTPFHNWSHAFTTLHLTFLLLRSSAFSGILEKQDIFALLLASMGHDLEHPGFTNAFQITSQSTLAIRYNDESVLENHHAAVTSDLLKAEPDMSSRLEAQLFRRVRKVLVTSILGTDMAKHHETMVWLESSNVDLPSMRKQKEVMESEQALLFCKALLHSADIGHPTSRWQVHKRISLLVAAEFYRQYGEETRLGFPTLPFMGKDPAQLAELAPIQVGFVQFVVAPLWSSVNFKAGEEKLEFAIKNIESNKRNWQKLADGQDVSDEQPFLTPSEHA